MVLQVGLLASGLPIPVAGLADAVLGPADRHSFLQSAAGLLPRNIPLDSLGSAMDAAAANSNKLALAIRDLKEGHNNSNIRCAYEAISAFLKQVDPTLENLGLIMVTSPSGKVAWVENNPVTIKQFMDNDGIIPGL